MVKPRVKPPCEHPGCAKSRVGGGTKHCRAHGGGKRCLETDCKKSKAPGGTQHCVGHGGGKPCQRANCRTAAIPGTSHCKAHGGGRRCFTDGCSKSAQADTDNCVAHGGGNRCQEEACAKSAIGGTGKCTAHGAGVKRCTHGNCTKRAVWVWQGLCIAHGGGHRCEVEDCRKPALQPLEQPQLCLQCKLAEAKAAHGRKYPEDLVLTGDAPGRAAAAAAER
jgi:hypothetical protein